MNYLLDANVLSEIWKPQPDPRVIAWFNSAEWFLPAPVVAEIQEGIQNNPSESKRNALNRKLDAILSEFPGAILSWDVETARQWGRLRHTKEVRRRPQPLWDSLIDAMGVRYGVAVATRNQGDFRHADTFNPWEFSPGPPA